MNTGLLREDFKYTGTKEESLFNEKSIVLKCIRNSFAAFQLIIDAGESCTVAMTDEPVFTIYPENPLYRIYAAIDGIGAVTIQNETLLPDDDGIPRADCIENRDYIHIQAGNPAVFWCEIPIPEDTEPGAYTGYVRIFTRKLFDEEKLVAEHAVSIEVVDIKLPKPNEYRLQLDLWQHLSNIARKHDVRLFSDDHFEIIGKYTASLARLGQKVITIIATDIPWSGQRTFNDLGKPTDLFEYSLIRTFKGKYGFRFDYSIMDRYIEMCFSHGIDSRIEVFGLCGIWMTEENGFGKAAPDFPDGVRIRYLDEITGTYSYMNSAAGIRLFIRSLYNHFIEKGWLDKVRITADEPGDIDLYKKTVSIILEEAPGFKLSIAINKAEFTTEFDDAMSEATPSLKCLAADYDFIKENLLGRDGKQVNWYVCCHPHFPNTFLQSHLVESRLIGIMTSLFGLDGFLRWNYTVWPEKPREDLVFRPGQWYAGDMNFVYPGNNGSPLLSLRYKALLRGIEDFELMAMAKDIGVCPDDEIYTLLLGETTLRELAEIGYDHPEKGRPFSTDGEDYDKFRELLYEALQP
ncbi:MAG: DUF4091 domain-containing protein [Clostridia bacterium]|nr:DUF4091 domain-containing protein [Clostridia bacterium]